MSFNENGSVYACLDGSAVSESVCDYAGWIAQQTRTPLTLLHTIEHKINAAVSDFSGAIGLGSQQELLSELTDVEQSRSQLLIKKGRLMLDAAKERVKTLGLEKIESYQHHGNLAESMIELEDKVRVMVIGIRGEAHESEQSGIGAQLENVIRSIHKPILVVNQRFEKPENTMLAYDGSASCKKALEMIASSELLKNIPCHLVHVGQNATQMLEEAKQQLQAGGVTVTSVELQGTVEQALTEYQTKNNIGLTLMGAFSHNRFRDLLLGSFTAKMLATTNRPLLLLR